MGCSSNARPVEEKLGAGMEEITGRQGYLADAGAVAASPTLGAKLRTMEFLRDLTALAVWRGAVETLVFSSSRLRAVAVPRAALRLAALPVLALLAEAVLVLPALVLPAGTDLCTPRPATLERLGRHPVLAPLGWVLAAPGLLSLAAGAWAALRRGRFGRLAASSALPVLVLGACCLPTWALDDRLYHLALPLHRLLGHAPIAGHGNEGFFALGEGAALWALAQGSVAAARTQQLWALHWGCRSCVALLPGATRATRLWAQALLVASPALLLQLGTGYVDVVVAAHQAVAAALLWRFLVAPQSGSAPAELLLGAWLMGAAAGTKALALGEVWAFVLVLALGLRRWRARGAAPNVPLVGAAMALLVAPWFGFVARNLCRYHAPLYPFGDALWPGGASLLPGQGQALAHFLQLHGPHRGSEALHGVAALLALPWALVFGAAFGSPKFDGVLGPLPAIAALAACWRAVARRWGRAAARAEDLSVPGISLRWVVASFVAVRLCVWTNTSWQARFLFGPLWWCAWAVAGGGLAALARAPSVVAQRTLPRSSVRRGAWWTTAAALFASALFWPSLRGHGPHLDARVLGTSDARHRARLARYPASALCDARPGDVSGTLLLVWTQRYLLWCLQPVRSDSYDEAATLHAALHAHAGAPHKAAAQLRRLGITELLVDEDLLGYAAPELDARGRADHAANWAAYVAFRRQTLQQIDRVGSIVRYRLAH